MEVTLTTYLIVCPLVFLAGFVDAVAGGGGLIALPAYILAGVPIHSSIATNKLSSVVGAVTSAVRFFRGGFIDLPFILPSVAAALAGSAAGAHLVMLTDADFMERLLLVVLPVAAYYVFRTKKFDPALTDSIPRRRAMILAAVISFLVGAYDGFYGPGTGTFLILLYASVCRMDVRMAAGNAKAVNLASNFAAVLTFLMGGKILIALGLTAALFSMAGSYIGSGLAMKKGYAVVRPVILIVLGLLFIKILAG